MAAPSERFRLLDACIAAKIGGARAESNQGAGLRFAIRWISRSSTLAIWLATVDIRLPFNRSAGDLV
jgi:hypothetical protein